MRRSSSAAPQAATMATGPAVAAGGLARRIAAAGLPHA